MFLYKFRKYRRIVNLFPDIFIMGDVYYLI
jgi:hypothetical protein